jgi:hypothetical protein
MFAAACSNPQGEDLDTFCKVVNDVNRDSSQPTAEAKLAKINERSAEYTKGGADSWKKLAAAPNDGKKYGMLMEAAKAAGKTDYKCTGFEKLLATAAVEETAKQKALEEKPDASAAPEEKPKPAEDTKASTPAKKKKHGKKKRHH